MFFSQTDALHLSFPLATYPAESWRLSQLSKVNSVFTTFESLSYCRTNADRPKKIAECHLELPDDLTCVFFLNPDTYKENMHEVRSAWQCTTVPPCSIQVLNELYNKNTFNKHSRPVLPQNNKNTSQKSYDNVWEVILDPATIWTYIIYLHFKRNKHMGTNQRRAPVHPAGGDLNRIWSFRWPPCETENSLDLEQVKSWNWRTQH